MTLLIHSISGLLILSVAVLGYGFYRTWKTGTYAEYSEFRSGTAPEVFPDGPWNGRAEELGDISWKGKKFLGNGRGINVFENSGTKTEAYPFSHTVADSIGMSGMKILKLDYNQPANPWWLTFIVDEMVSVGQNQFLGIVYIKLIPGFPFRMGYFRLTK